jgi:hypothetical protein
MNMALHTVVAPEITKKNCAKKNKLKRNRIPRTLSHGVTLICNRVGMILELITAAEANAIIGKRHYLGPVIFPPRYCIATPARDAVAIFSYPMAASFKVKFNALELSRLFRAEGAPVRTDHFLDRACRKVTHELAPKTDCIFTYADPLQGHTGKVYLGSGFTRLNEQIRVTDSWETPDGERLSSGQVYRELKTKSRECIIAARPDWKLIAGAPKLLFVRPAQMRLAEIRAIIEAPLPDDRRKLFSKAYGGFRVAAYQEKFPPKKCEHCRRMFLAKRADARTCSDKCRQALSRRSRKRKR